MCALSRSMMSHRCAVGTVAWIGPEKPCLNSSGMRPEWSMCACVTSRKSIWAGVTGSGAFSKKFFPCSMP